MDEKEFNTKLRELIKEIASLPKEQQKKLAPMIGETVQRHKEVKDDMSKVAQSLTSLRICLKYIMFDLEATRRERDQLRKMLEDKPQEDDPNTASGEM